MKISKAAPAGALVGLLLLSACATSSNKHGLKGAPPSAGAAKPSNLKPPPEEVPADVKRIEAQIERKSAILGREIEIHVSKNYEWDVGLSGDEVSPHTPFEGGTLSVARGHPRATFRNLELRADRQIAVRFSGLDVVPFIKVTARGSASYIDLEPGETFRSVRRAGIIRIENETISFLGDTDGSRETGIPASEIDDGTGGSDR